MLERTPPVSDEQADFGAQLRLARERRAVALSTVAETTKIAESLLAALERGDISKWPHGIYRRAFFREYATAIGLPADAATADFQRLFLEATSVSREGGDLRLTLAPEKPRRARSTMAGIATAALDAGAILLAGFAVSRALTLDFWIVTAVLALAYQILGTVVLRRSPALFMMTSAWTQRERSIERVRPSSRAVLRVVRPEQRRKAS
jgi:hypothetical protein